MYKKRGQATILILMGLVVLGLVAGVYFTKDYVLKSKLERQSEKTLVVPRQAEGVKNYVVSCIEQVTNEAVDLAGQRGGYIEIPGDVIPYGPYNKFSNSLEVLPGLRVPYWYYKQANNVDKLQILNLNQIGNNVKNYIDEQLRVCVGDFSVFKGYKINPGLIDSEVEIQNNNILFGIKFPIHMEIKDFKFDFKEFYSKIDKPLGELYDISKGIFNYENGKNFLEEKTIDIMVAYEEIPTSGESTSCVPPVWNKFKVIEDLKKGLLVNIQSLKLKDSNYVLSDKSKEYYEIDIGSVGNIDANFMYSERWPFELEVEPEDNSILKAESATAGLGSLRGIVESFGCLSSWHFVYSIKYPVLVVLSKDDYTFQYSTMVVIDRNEPRENIQIPGIVPSIDKRYCENKQYNLYVSVYDDSGSPVNDVDISYQCINHLCELGKSVGNYFNGLVMPCSNGFVIANKEGYHTSKTQVSTVFDGSASIVMEKYRELNVGVEVLRAGSGELRQEEDVYITLLNEEEDYGVSIVYPDVNNIKLIPGDYKANIYMMTSSEGIKVPAKEVENCVRIPKKGFMGVFGATEIKCTTTEIPSMELDNVITGMVEYDFSISKDDLNKNKIIFYVPYQGLPKSYDELSKLEGGEIVYPKFS